MTSPDNIMTDTKHDIYILDKTTNETHRARKIIFNDYDISVWSDTWYGRHVIGKDCEFEQPKVSENETLKDLSMQQLINILLMVTDELGVRGYIITISGNLLKKILSIRG